MTKRLNKGFTLVELLIVIVIVGILALAAILLVSNYVDRAKAAEAETAIGSIKRHLEVYFTEFDTDAADMATLEADGYVTTGSFNGQYYDTYTWGGAIANHRYVGDIVATARANSGAPEVTITYAADGTASIARVPAP